MSNPRASVVIPAYNAAKTIEATLKSLFDQTTRDFEIVVVDDGSQDETPSMCRNLQCVSPIPMTILRQGNKGEPGARNTGISVARGKYIIFLDADDLAERNYVARLLGGIESDNNVDIACCSFDLLYEDGTSKPRLLKSKRNKMTISGIEALKLLLKEKLEVWSGSAIYRHSLFNDYNVYFNESITMGEDIDFRWRAFYHARAVVLIPEILVHYVQHGSSITRAMDPNRFPPSSWLDPQGFLEYMKEQKEADESLLSLFVEFVVPLFTVRHMRNYILYGLDDLFWEALKDEAIKDTLRRGAKAFRYKPELSLKCVALLLAPRLFYKRYKSRNARKGS